MARSLIRQSVPLAILLVAVPAAAETGMGLVVGDFGAPAAGEVAGAVRLARPILVPVLSVLVRRWSIGVLPKN